MNSILETHTISGVYIQIQIGSAGGTRTILTQLPRGGNEIVSRESIGNVEPGMSMIGDSDTIELSRWQNELVHEISKLGKPMVAVLLNGKAYAMEQLASEVPATVEGWYLGQGFNNASSVSFNGTSASFTVVSDTYLTATVT